MMENFDENPNPKECEIENGMLICRIRNRRRKNEKIEVIEGKPTDFRIEKDIEINKIEKFSQC